jgi:tetrahydromethanopterin S-methyltransferase subunit E
MNIIFDSRVVSHDSCSSVYLILSKLGHMISLWNGKNPIYFGVIWSKVKVTVTINIIFDNRLVSQDNFSSVYWIFTNLYQMISLWKSRNPIYFGVISSKVNVTVTMHIIFDNRIFYAR